MQRNHFDTAIGRQSGLYFGDPKVAPSLVFAHANGMHARAYAPLLEDVARQSGRTILALDLRGHGESQLFPLTARTARWPNLATDYAAALEALGLENITLAGHSIGAVLSLMVAAQHPKRVKNLVLFDPVLLPHWLHVCANFPILDQASRLHPLVRKAKSRQDTFSSTDEARQKWSKARVFSTWADGYFEAYVQGALLRTKNGDFTLNCPPFFEVQCFRQLTFWPQKLVGLVKQPVRIFCAAQGSTLTKGVRAHIFKNCPNIKVSVEPGTGHFLPLEKPTQAITHLSEGLH